MATEEVSAALAKLGIGSRDAVRANRIDARKQGKEGNMGDKHFEANEVAELAEKLAMDEYQLPLKDLTSLKRACTLCKARALLEEPQNNNVRKEK